VLGASSISDPDLGPGFVESISGSRSRLVILHLEKIHNLLIIKNAIFLYLGAYDWLPSYRISLILHVKTLYF
jgi:hypothetical protein